MDRDAGEVMAPEYHTVIFTDLDDTLAPIHESLQSRHVSAIEDLVRHGALIICITGADSKETEQRLGYSVDSRFRQSIWMSCCYGMNLFRVGTRNDREYAYDRTSAIDKFRDVILMHTIAVASSMGLGQVINTRGENAETGRICIENKDGQVTLTFLGLEKLRQQAAVTLRQRLTEDFEDSLIVSLAGRKSIDIRVADSNKSEPIRFVIQNRRAFDISPDARILVAGDKFGPGEADAAMLDESIIGATVFAVDGETPRATGFSILENTAGTIEGTYKFLAKFAMQQSVLSNLDE